MRKKLFESKKNIVFCVCILMMGLFNPGSLLAEQSKKEKDTVIEKDFYNGTSIRIDVLTNEILRIRIVPKGKKLPETGLNRYGFIGSELENDLFPVNISKTKNHFTAETSVFKLQGNCSSGELIITNPNGEKTLLHQTSSGFKDSYSEVNFRADKSEDWIGFGDQSRRRLYHRGHIADCYVRNVVSYIPVPFFMSTQGVGVLVNTTYRTVFDMCKSDPDNYSWKEYDGAIDYYVMVGDGFGKLIDLYTDLTGKPKLPPEWSFGLWYVCRDHANDYEVVNDAWHFRQAEIPCDVIGLEPGWMDKRYDYSIEKSWSQERFPMFEWTLNSPYNFIGAIKRMGFKMELWLCNDYDLSYEEERKIKNEIRSQDLQHLSNKENDDVEFDEHLKYTVHMDRITKKDEPWFKHLEKFVDQGISFFKQDASNQVLDHPDRLYGNGMLEEEMHNLYSLLYSRQMYEGYAAYTNLRPVIFTPCGWTGFQAWAGTWTGDTGGELTTLGAMMNTSIVGHSWCTNDMETVKKEGIHFGYLQPWSQINSYSTFDMPWLQGSEILNMHKYYSQLREKLIPYLYSWGYVATQTGWPLLRPLTLDFPEDKNCRDNLHQYFLGRDLLVGIFKTNMYFPKGRWKDYWTGKVIEETGFKDVSWPDDKGGALYIRSGAIIPMGPVMQYWGEKPMDEVSLYVFPDSLKSEFDLYEDDGVTFENQKEKYSLTHISTRKENDLTTINIDEPKGTYTGKVENRTWEIIVHQDEKPGSVWNNGEPISQGNYSWNNERKELMIYGIISPAKIKIKH